MENIAKPVPTKYEYRCNILCVPSRHLVSWAAAAAMAILSLAYNSY